MAGASDTTRSEAVGRARRAERSDHTNIRISGINRPKSLTDSVYERLKAAIRNQTLRQRHFYPLGEIAAGFGISRTPVREAVIRLAQAGLVEVAPQRGFRVREIPPNEGKEVFELRSLIEGHAVEKLAKKATDEDLRVLRNILRRQQRLTNDVSKFLDVDEAFHLEMVDRAGLRRAHDFLSTLRDIIWLLGYTALSVPGRLEEVLAEHTAIVDRIEKRDRPGARKALDAHLESTRSKILRLSSTDGTDNTSG